MVNVDTTSDVMGGGVALAMVRAWLMPAALVLAGMPTVAAAQVDEGLVVQPAVPQGFDRGRNVSVAGASRPDYQPIGIKAGGVLIFPRLRAMIGGTTNTYLTNSNTIAAPFVAIEPSITARTNWSRHSLQVNASTRPREYIGQARRRERNWNLGTSGGLEFGSAFRLNFDLDASQESENQFSGEVASSVAAVSRYRRDYVLVQGTYQSGRGRAFVIADVADFRFDPVPLTNGNFRDQSDRDREVKRVIAQVEYARTPSVSLFGQLSYTGTTFDGRILQSIARRNSATTRAMGGLNVDIAGRARGTVGVGYSIRDYDASVYQTIRGLSAEAQLELFPTRLFTITAGAQRTIEDSSFGTRSAFFDTRFSLRGDYEVLHNLILSGSAEFSKQDYIGENINSSTYRAGTSARYLVSRRLTLDAGLSYARRQNSGSNALNNTNEARVEAGITFHI